MKRKQQSWKAVTILKLVGVKRNTHHQVLGLKAGSEAVTEAGNSRADEERLAETAMHACKNSACARACVCVF